MKRVKLLVFLLPALILLFCPSNVLAEAKTFDTIKDTYANQAYPDQNRGTLGSVIVSNKNTTRLGYLQFEELDLPEGAIFDQAVINFSLSEVHYSDRAKVNIGPISENWEETAVTWNNKPTINQVEAIEAEFSLTAVGWRQVDITPVVRRWIEGTTENRGIFIYPYGFLYGGTETEYAFTLRSKESGTERANLVVEYHFEATPTSSPTPEPTETIAPEASPVEEEEVFEEETPTPTPEEEKEGTVSGLSTGQMVIGGLILLSLVGAGIALLIYALRKPKKKVAKKKKEEKPQEETPEEV
jgi:hypothetical protein